MSKIMRTDGSGEHKVVFTEGADKHHFNVSLRHQMGYDDRQQLKKEVAGISHCFGSDGGYSLKITTPPSYARIEVIPKVSKWLAAYLCENHPQTVMHKICAACCPFYK